MYNGLFTSPEVLFPSKKEQPTEDQLTMWSGLVSAGDLLTDNAMVSGTVYRIGQIVVTAVSCSDLITVGEVIQLILRRKSLLFVVSVHDAIRTPFGFWQACPSNKVDIIDQRSLGDFKPLFKRDDSNCFRFVLHHHLPTPLE